MSHSSVVVSCMYAVAMAMDYGPLLKMLPFCFCHWCYLADIWNNIHLATWQMQVQCALYSGMVSTNSCAPECSTMFTCY